MTTDELTDLLRDLPPDMRGPADRFAAVERRARRRARTTAAAVTGVVAAVVVAGGTAVLTAGTPTTGTGPTDLATQPPSPSRSAGIDTSQPLPGATTAVPLGDAVVVTRTGTSTVELGPRPTGATAARVSVACLTAGRIAYPDGSSVECDGPASDAEVADPATNNYAIVDLPAGRTSLTFTARDGVGWKVVAAWVRTETSEWGVNAKGETYGVQRDGRSPDLLAVVTTDGRQGYAYVEELDGGPPPTSPADALAQQEADAGVRRSVPVYESDGETLIGEFLVG
ncbi:hypothetical protein KDN32_18120 [Nocardioides sp. J2M5]|uniref:hypothetical protein n=1 Tax=Nocardioides palaemonis TaxID=2829810 RepID=UPI001BAE4AA0|nr:hypothetical protein [Nocardioides palaemonis]MBS2939660.1 hypothetical protein [Nocardioides palaemonis]